MHNGGRHLTASFQLKTTTQHNNNNIALLWRCGKIGKKNYFYFILLARLLALRPPSACSIRLIVPRNMRILAKLSTRKLSLTGEHQPQVLATQVEDRKSVV